jgi:hypothetical protein
MVEALRANKITIGWVGTFVVAALVSWLSQLKGWL